MPDSILHRTKTHSAVTITRVTGHKIIPQRYKFLHKNIVVLFSLPDVYAALGSRWQGVRDLATVAVCVSVRRQHYWDWAVQAVSETLSWALKKSQLCKAK